MDCLIFSGGDFPDPAWHLRQIKEGDYLIAADKGAEYILALGYLPNIVIGDLDSIDEEIKKELIAKGVEFKISPKEKNQTDTELALLYALSLKPNSITLFSATGDRLDHFLANIFLLTKYLAKGIPIYFKTPIQTLWVTDKSTVVRGFPNQEISLQAISQEVTGLTLKGFYYSLNNGVLPFGSSLGISNLLLDEEGHIKLKKGILLICQHHEI